MLNFSVLHIYYFSKVHNKQNDSGSYSLEMLEGYSTAK